LTEIINHATIPQQIDFYVLGGIDKTKCILYVPAASINTYRTAEGWKEFKNIKMIN
jgi:hypothetical protein